MIELKNPTTGPIGGEAYARSMYRDPPLNTTPSIAVSAFQDFCALGEQEISQQNRQTEKHQHRFGQDQEEIPAAPFEDPLPGHYRTSACAAAGAGRSFGGAVCGFTPLDEGKLAGGGASGTA